MNERGSYHYVRGSNPAAATASERSPRSRRSMMGELCAVNQPCTKGFCDATSPPACGGNQEGLNIQHICAAATQHLQPYVKLATLTCVHPHPPYAKTNTVSDGIPAAHVPRPRGNVNVNINNPVGDVAASRDAACDESTVCTRHYNRNEGEVETARSTVSGSRWISLYKHRAEYIHRTSTQATTVARDKRYIYDIIYTLRQRPQSWEGSSVINE